MVELLDVDQLASAREQPIPEIGDPQLVGVAFAGGFLYDIHLGPLGGKLFCSLFPNVRMSFLLLIVLWCHPESC